MTEAFELLYRPRGKFATKYAGAHASSEVGGFGVFRDQVPFLRRPDARRIDLRATLRDPFGETYVRRFEQRSAIDVYALVDLSASMTFIGAVDRFAVACDLCEALAIAATRIGDRFGLIGCGRELRRETTFAPMRAARAARAAVEKIRHAPCDDRGADAFVEAAPLLGASRKLAFLISDFRWPEAIIDRVLSVLARHDVVPLVLVDSVEASPPEWGLLALQDAETGQRKTLAMRPGLQRNWIELERARRQRLARLAADRARNPIFLTDGFDPVGLSRRLSAA
jgi:uncharacterized protein (DUF58 family)